MKQLPNQSSRRQFLVTAGASAAILAAPHCAWSAAHADRSAKVKVLMLSGQNNHDWKRTTPLMEKILLDSSRFEVSISNSPPSGSPAAAWESWRPKFKDFDVVFSDYNGDQWPEVVRQEFVSYVNDGGRVLIQHAANNAFPGWTEYEKMCGLLWRGKDEGKRVYLDDEGKKVEEPAGMGPGAGHGRLHDWTITSRATHPIFTDMPVTWLHAFDELYHGQRGPAENMNILATAQSTVESGGTGKHELMVWWIPFGQGKVLSMMPGHLWSGQEDLRAFQCVGFRTLLQRSTEWVATDQVSIELPDPFPTAEKTCVIS